MPRPEVHVAAGSRLAGAQPAGRRTLPDHEADAALARLRAEIDLVNAEILRAIERRGALVLRIVQIKRQAGMPPVDPARETEMMARIAARVRGPFSRAAIQAIFRTILAASRALQR